MFHQSFLPIYLFSAFFHVGSILQKILSFMLRKWSLLCLLRGKRRRPDPVVNQHSAGFPRLRERLARSLYDFSSWRPGTARTGCLLPCKANWPLIRPLAATQSYLQAGPPNGGLPWPPRPQGWETDLKAEWEPASKGQWGGGRGWRDDFEWCLQGPLHSSTPRSAFPLRSLAASCLAVPPAGLVLWLPEVLWAT